LGEHRDSSNTEMASSNGADTFVWSDTFKRADGANPASADEGHRAGTDAISEESEESVGQMVDLDCDGHAPDMAHTTVAPATAMDHWLM